MSDRLTKQQLKEDPLMERLGSLAEFTQNNVRAMIGAGVLLVAAVAAVLFLRAGALQAEENAAGLLAGARSEVERGVFDSAASRLDDILRTAGRTKSGKEARLLYGDIRFAQNNYSEAEVHYRKAVDEFNLRTPQGVGARRGLAATLENTERNADAAEIYRELAEATSIAGLKASLLMDVARNLLLAGQAEAAAAILEDLSTNRDNPRVAQDAQLRLAELARPPAG